MEVIKVIDLTGTGTHCGELMFLKIHDCSEDDIRELFRMASAKGVAIPALSPSDWC